MKIIENNPRVSELDQSLTSGTRTSPTTRPVRLPARTLFAARRDRGLSRGGRGSLEEAGFLGKRGFAAYVERRGMLRRGGAGARKQLSPKTEGGEEAIGRERASEREHRGR